MDIDPSVGGMHINSTCSNQSIDRLLEPTGSSHSIIILKIHVTASQPDRKAGNIHTRPTGPQPSPLNAPPKRLIAKDFRDFYARERRLEGKGEIKYKVKLEELSTRA